MGGGRRIVSAAWNAGDEGSISEHGICVTLSIIASMVRPKRYRYREGNAGFEALPPEITESFVSIEIRSRKSVPISNVRCIRIALSPLSGQRLSCQTHWKETLPRNH